MFPIGQLRHCLVVSISVAPFLCGSTAFFRVHGRGIRIITALSRQQWLASARGVASQIFTVSSQLAEANRFPSRLNATALTR